MVPIYPFLCDYKRVFELDPNTSAYAELRYYFRNFDPLHEREMEIVTKLGYIDIQHLAERIRGEVLMAIGFLDQVCPPSTQFAVYNKIKSPKKICIYPDYGHEYIPDFDDKVFKYMMGL
jgi:cephalosporin-C deacetylase